MEVIRRSIQLNSCLLQMKSYSLVPVRAVSVNRKEVKTNCDLALEVMDATYNNTYGRDWPSVRLALLCRSKYVAILNNHAPNFPQHVQKFQGLGCMDVGARYRANCELINATQQAKLLQNQFKPSTATNNSNVHNKQTKRLPQREMSDEQLAAQASADPPTKYPEQYRQLTGAEELVDTPNTDRLLLPQPGIEYEVPPLHDFVPSTSMHGIDPITEESDIFKKFGVDTLPGEGPGVLLEECNDQLHWPEMLSVMAFPQAHVATFPKPSMDHGLYDHYALDGASLLPVLLMGVRPNDAVLDMCAAPGGKTLALLQTCSLGSLLSNDSSLSRVRRIKSMVKQYFSDTSSAAAVHNVTQSDGRYMPATYNSFDRVLVDVPCLTDRHSVNEPDNNIFKKTRLKERLAMPEVQSELLVEALKQVRVGGTVVYSTCSLSPSQNDGVVHLALNRLWDNTDIQCKVVNYTNCLEPLRFIYKFANPDSCGLRYGQVVLPWLPNNYGPMYCARLVRTN